MEHITRKPGGVLAAITGICLIAGCGQQVSPLDDPLFVQAMNEGVGHMGQFDYAPAVDAFALAVQRQPGSVDAKVNLAVAYFNRNKD